MHDGHPEHSGAAASSLPWVMAFTECHLPGLAETVVIAVAALLAQIPALAVVIHASAASFFGFTGPAHPTTQPGPLWCTCR
jgi:hypothetical protein